MINHICKFTKNCKKNNEHEILYCNCKFNQELYSILWKKDHGNLKMGKSDVHTCTASQPQYVTHLEFC